MGQRWSVPGHPDARSVCAVPSASFRVLPNGQMDACCINEKVWLGHYPTTTLHEAWAHPQLRRLRERLARGDFGLGCGSCGAAYRRGERHLTHAESFDRFLDDPPSPYPRVLEFSLSNRCNLACVMCSGDVSSRIRAEREHLPPLHSPYDDAFFDELEHFLPHLESAFFAGGEPFLSPLNDRVWDAMLRLDAVPRIGITTNGTVVGERVERYLRSLRMDVSVSIDGTTAATNEAIRIGVDHEQVREHLDWFRRVTASYGGTVRVNFALQQQNWTELADLLVDAESRDIDVWLSIVRFPLDRSLLALPRSELARIDSEWAAQSDRVGSLVVNRKSWDAARGAVGDQLRTAGRRRFLRVRSG